MTDRPDEAPPIAELAPLPLAPGETLPRPIFVRLALALAAAIILLAVGTIGWRWFSVSFPNAILLTRGDASSEGVEIIVSADNGREIARNTLTTANDHSFVVLVEQGVYAVRADANGKPFLHRRFYVPNARAVTVDIEVPADVHPTTAPATRPE